PTSEQICDSRDSITTPLSVVDVENKPINELLSPISTSSSTETIKVEDCQTDHDEDQKTTGKGSTDSKSQTVKPILVSSSSPTASMTGQQLDKSATDVDAEIDEEILETVSGPS